LIKHKQLYLKRNNISQKNRMAYSLFFCVLLIFLYQIIYVLLQSELILLFYWVVLILDFSFKFFFKNLQINILPYWVLPYKKKTLVKAVLLTETFNIWNWYWIISILFLFFKRFFSTSGLNWVVFSICLFLLFFLNSYYIMAIKNGMNRILSFLLLPLFCGLLFPVYFMFYTGILCAIITLGLIICLFYANIYILNNKIYQQLNECSL
jgi:hypothetical protein